MFAWCLLAQKGEKKETKAGEKHTQEEWKEGKGKGEKGKERAQRTPVSGRSVEAKVWVVELGMLLDFLEDRKVTKLVLILCLDHSRSFLSQIENDAGEAKSGMLALRGIGERAGCESRSYLGALAGKLVQNAVNSAKGSRSSHSSTEGHSQTSHHISEWRNESE